MAKPKEVEFLDLSNPKEARRWLKTLRLKGFGIETIVISNEHDREVTVDEATDEEILRVAANIYRMLHRDTAQA